jgi:hypothetical protein
MKAAMYDRTFKNPMNFLSAMNQAHANKVARLFPDLSDSRSREGVVFPVHNRKFSVRFSPDQTVFTIGSCFARNIEEALFEKNVSLPTRAFSVPRNEWKLRPNGLLNEYNPGTISQRILYALQGRDFPAETIVPTGDLFTDLLLPFGGISNVSRDRALERRAQIKTVYDHLPKSDLVIITLGYIEAWYDTETKVFLNRAPPLRFGSASPERFVLRQLDVVECLSLLEEAIGALGEAGIKTILTVSPVPISLTFTSQDCVIANEYSKSVLRVCAERLCRFEHVDYFPSYEIVRSGGVSAYVTDQVHVKDSLVREIVRYMVSSYTDP